MAGGQVAWEKWLGVNAASADIGTVIALVLLIIFTARPVLDSYLRILFYDEQVSTKEGLIAKRRGMFR